MTALPFRLFVFLATIAGVSCGPARNGSKQWLHEGYTPLITSADLPQWDYRPGHRGHWTVVNGMIRYDGSSAESDRSLWTIKSYRDFILSAEVRLTRPPEMRALPVILPDGRQALNPDGTKKTALVQYAGDTGIYLRGESKSQVNIGYRNIGSGEIYGYRVDTLLSENVRRAVTPKEKADNPPGSWNRFVITMKGEKVSVRLNGKEVVHEALLPGVPTEGRIALQDDHESGNLFEFRNIFIKEI